MTGFAYTPPESNERLAPRGRTLLEREAEKGEWNYHGRLHDFGRRRYRTTLSGTVLAVGGARSALMTGSTLTARVKILEQKSERAGDLIGAYRDRRDANC